MKKVLLLSAAAMLALGCATAANVPHTAAVRDGGAALAAPAPEAAVHAAALREPADAPARVASADRGAPDGTIGAARMRGGEGRAALRANDRGRAPSEGYGGSSRNPEATACGGTDNNPAGEGSLFIPELKAENGGSAGEDGQGPVAASGRKMREALTPAAAVEGSNPTEDGALFIPGASGRSRDGDKARSSRPAGRLPEALSPMATRANNNPADDAADLRLPEATGASRSADRFGAARTAAPHAVGEGARVQNRAGGVLQRRDAKSDNNPLDTH